MKLTKKLEAEVLKTYQASWDALFRGDIKTFASLLDDKVVIYGSAAGEVFTTKKAAVKFYIATADQITGKVDLRNRNIGLKAVNNTVIVHELCELFFLTEQGWVFYGPARITDILEKKGTTWKIIHHHTSFPDSRTIEGEQFATEKIKAENLLLRDAVQRRTVELQHKNRELEIETALEKVRTVAMGMKQAEDMLSICKTISQQLESLGVQDIRNIQTAIIHKEKGTYTNYEFYTKHNKLLTTEVSYINHAMSKAFVKKMQEGPNVFYKRSLKGKKVQEWFSFQKKSTNQFADTHLAKASSLNYYWYSLGPVALGVSTYVPLNKEQEELVVRFKNVFELAYRRYIDIEKATAQAREAQIEAALERVRSRSTAMHKSEELKEVIQLMFEQFRLLNFKIDSAQFDPNYKENDDLNLWTAAPGQPYSILLNIPYFDNPIFNSIKEAKKRGLTFITQQLSLDEKNQFFRHFFLHIKNIPAERQKFIFDSPGMYRAAVFMENVSLAIQNYSNIPYTEEENAVIKRFGKTFEQVYTRFLDLQKAEAQAREAQIEAAMEKVRSRSLAMHRSDELKEVVSVLFEKLKELQIPFTAIGIGTYIQGSKDLDSYVCGENEAGLVITNYCLPYIENKIPKDLFNALEKQLDFFVGHYSKEEKNAFYTYVIEHTPEFRHLPDDIKRIIFDSTKYTISMVAVKNAVFSINDFQGKILSDNEIDIIKRFARVFDQAYTRFLDLQKAEAQAREAQIERALEKVRSRSLAMQNPDELIEVAHLLREEMGALGVEALETSSIYIHDDNNGKTQCWFTIKNTDNSCKAVTDQMTIDLQETWVGQQMYAFYKSAERQISIRMQGEKRIDWIRYCEEKSDLFGTSNFYGDTIPERTYHLVKFSNGFLGAAAPGEISKESSELLKRATAVFSFAYTRFRDLQMTEASAHAARRQASLDRVRADISSMRHADDLDRITPLIFSELHTLGIPFIRCGVFIVHEKSKMVDVYLSSPVGKSLAAMKLAFDANSLTVRSVEAWKSGEVYTHHWDKEDFINFGKLMVAEGQVKDMNTYQGNEEAPEVLHLHFIPFTQGILYVGATETLDDDKIDMIKALSRVFATAYARYEDFIKLKAAKNEVDKTLQKLKMTQTQLIQAEKLASLGQLTAGIAHEIQNPLNFVNNFSEVNSELISELVEEVDKGNISEVKLIATDIKENSEKINHHGKRADAIVKGMLQHSSSGSGKKEPTNINALADEYLRLAYHGLRAKDKEFNATMKTDFDESIGNINIIPQDIGRVILNLITNAFYVVHEKKKQDIGGYEPTVEVSTKKVEDKVEVKVKDNGPGIPDAIKDKIFQPFFTTKPTGQGTGLGLSLSYDIVKAHGGELSVRTPLEKVETKEGGGSEFIIQLPISKKFVS